MNKLYKILAIVAGAMLLTGGILVGIAFAVGVKSHVKLFDNIDLNFGSGRLNTLAQTEVDPFTSIDASLDMGNIIIEEGDSYGISYSLNSDTPEYYVKNNTLTFREKSTWGINLNFFNWGGKNTKLVIYVPKGTKLTNVDLDSSMGDIHATGLVADTINATSNMGDIILTDVTMSGGTFSSDMGTVNLAGVFEKKLKITSNMGDVNITGYVACDVDAGTDMGDVNLTTYYSKDAYSYSGDSDMGKFKVHDNGGKSAPGKNYDLSLSSDMGDITINFGK